jgi:LmbE family N-acetylglucosaminyl deacetylase
MIMRTTLILFVLVVIFQTAKTVLYKHNTLKPLNNTRILLVDAHPDDEVLFSSTLFKLIRKLGASADMITITNGEGGIQYVELGEYYYGFSIDQYNLPIIRKRELLESAKVIGISTVHTLDEQDKGYSTDIHIFDDGKYWDLELIRSNIIHVLEKNEQVYDYVFLMIPHNGQHAHHKMSCILALQSLERLYKYSESVSRKRPIIIAGTEPVWEDYVQMSDGYENITRAVLKTDLDRWGIQLDSPVVKITSKGAVTFVFDRKTSWMGKLNYKTPFGWALASHKTQGAVLEDEYYFETENYWTMYQYVQDPRVTLPKLQQLFDLLKKESS